MSYTTTSGFSDLVGSCEITGTNVTSYTSNTQGTVTPENLGGPNLHFKVKFDAVTHPYVINANASGNGFSGNAKDKDGLTDAEETWAATATAAEAAYAKGE